MCATCGCSEVTVYGEAGGSGHDHEHALDHDHEHDHVHDHDRSGAKAFALSPSKGPLRLGGRMVRLEQAVLGKNDAIAAANRAWLEARGIVALNLVSSPGAGKTTLLERTIRELRDEIPVAVIEGDQETPLDADRIRAAGCPVVQINTGRGCHLDAAMVARAIAELAPAPGSLLLVENVGNLVCPALFDLGERAKVVVASTAEGEEKPLKYPHMFRASALMLLNKIDLAAHLGFDAARCAANARTVNPHLEVLEVSARRGDGLDAWHAWLRAQRARSVRP